MQAIKDKNTGIEILVRSYLHKKGFRFRLHIKDLPGRPDLVLKRYNAVIFINGCFWHQHDNCHLAARPKSNSNFWNEKLRKNKARDEDNIDKLNQLGWNVMIVWECELKGNPEKRLKEIQKELLGER